MCVATTISFLDTLLETRYCETDNISKNGRESHRPKGRASETTWEARSQLTHHFRIRVFPQNNCEGMSKRAIDVFSFIPTVDIYNVSVR